MRERAPRLTDLQLILLALGGATGCQEVGGADVLYRVGKDLVAVETLLPAAEVRAGEVVAVRCQASYDDGTRQLLTLAEVTIAVSPARGVNVDGLELSTNKAGSYLVECKKAGFEGSKPAELKVKAEAPARVVATLERPEAPAGTTVGVACVVEDRFGNEVRTDRALVRASPSRGIRVSEGAVATEKVGEYSITCALENLERVPATLTVVPGTPTRVAVELSSYSVMAGETVQASCIAVDAYANRLVVPADIGVSPIPDQNGPTGIMATTAGPYWVSCSLPAGVSSEPVLLTVTPALPATLMIVGVMPRKPVYSRTEIIEPNVLVNDVYGNEVSAYTLGFASDPVNGAVDVGFNQVMLVGDGRIQIIVSVISPTHDGRPVGDRVTVEVDGQPPVIDIIFPRRAEMVQADPTRPLTIRGRVLDMGSGVTELSVNGAMIRPAANGDFTATMQPHWGINVIEASAFDSVGNHRELVQSYEIASSYKRASPSRTQSGRVADGIIAHLGQPALDDNASDIDDLATIARLAIQNMDVGALIPSPVTTYNSDCSIPFVTIRGALQLHVDSVSYGTPVIDINSINGGVFLRVEIPSVVVRMHTRGDVCEIGVNISGTASASRIVVSGNLMVSRVNGQTRVTMPSRTVDIQGLRINLNLPSIIDWAVDGIISLFSGMITNRLESAFGQVIADEVPPVLVGFINSFGLETGFDLPAPFSMRLGVSSGIGMIQFDTVGGNLGLDATIFANGRISPEPIGGILQERQTIPTFDRNRALAVALGYDLVNQALYSFYYGGGMSFDLTQLLRSQMTGGAQIRGTARGLLPAVVRPTGNASAPVELQAGDLEVVLDVSGVQGLPPIQVTLYASLFAQADITINARQEVELMLAPNPTVQLQLESALDGYLDTALLVNAIELAISTVVPQLIGQVLKGIPIPSFNLSTLAGGYLPPGIVLGLGNARTRFHPSYLVLEGNLVQVP